MQKNSLKQRINAGETVSAAWLELGSPDVAEILIHAGWDTLIIDCEHGVAGLERGLELIRAVEAAGGHAIVRVPDAAEATLKRAVDRGARSLLVPMVNSTDAARQAASFVRYAPMGSRGYAAPIVRASGYGKWVNYAREANDEVFLAVQIEHKDAIAHVPEIGEIEGIDMAFIGPNDLAASMGFIEQLQAPKVSRAIAEIETKAKGAGLKLGTIEFGQRDLKSLASDGYSLVVGPNDVSLLANAARAEARKRDAGDAH